jgi:AraC-like DNA-binding protein
MQVAGEKLRNTSGDIGSIARSVGYQSEAAFSNAFKRVQGYSPRAYRYGNVKSGSKHHRP